MATSASALDLAVEEIVRICQQSQHLSQVFLYGSSGYKDSVRHFLLSSCETARIAVQPGSPEDLGKILKGLGRYRIPFAVKGGGHAMAPKLSSTTGVQIYMARFSYVNYDPTQKTVDIGAGCLWNEVHRALDPHHVNVVGGSRVTDVGIAGWLLGGGYSSKTNQYGMGIDNIIRFQVVLPNGEFIKVVDTDHHPDLFEALKGGGNNFGIVTQFTLKTHYQPEHTYGGHLNIYEWDERYYSCKKAVANFAENETRPKAMMVAGFAYVLHQGLLTSALHVDCFYDGPEQEIQSDDPFKEFRALDPEHFQPDPDRVAARKAVAEGPLDHTQTLSVNHDISFGERPFVELDGMLDIRFGFTHPRGARDDLKAMEGIGEIPHCARFGCIMISRYNQKIIDVISEAAQKPALKMKEHGGLRVSLYVWPFVTTIFDHSTPSAWPHPRGESYGPLIAHFEWESEKESDFWIQEMNASLEAVRQVALQEGCTKDTYPIYQNMTPNTTPVRDIFRGNLERLGAIRVKYDPHDIMSNAAGFRIPLYTAGGSR